MKIITLAAALLLATGSLAATSAQAEPHARMKSQNNLKQMGLAATDQGGATGEHGSSDLAQPVRKTASGIELICPDKTYILTSGTKKGSCSADLFTASCGDGANGAKASCHGCTSSSGAGSCKTK
ncbi:hypothetical protein BH11PSE1_BH11PSE1_24250 [soil metagenome]